MKKTMMVPVAVFCLGCSSFLSASADNSQDATFKKNSVVKSAESFLTEFYEPAEKLIEKLKTEETEQVESDQLKEKDDLAEQGDMANQIEQIQATEAKEHKKWADKAVSDQKTLDSLAQQIDDLNVKLRKAELEGPKGDAPAWAEQVDKLAKEERIEEKTLKADQAKDATVQMDANQEIQVRKNQEATSGLEAKDEATQAGVAQSEATVKIEKIVEDATIALKDTAPGQIQAAKSKERQYLAEQGDMASQIAQIEATEAKEHKKWADKEVSDQKTLDLFAKQIEDINVKLRKAELEGPKGDAPALAEQVDKLTKEASIEEKTLKVDEFKDAKVQEDANAEIQVRKNQEGTFGEEAAMEAYIAKDIQSRVDKAMERLKHQEKTQFEDMESTSPIEGKTVKTKKTKHPKLKKPVK